MEIIAAHCAGIDVGKTVVQTAVRVPDGEGGRRKETRTYQTHTGSLEALAEWLDKEGVTEVAMEATGDYWKPVWYVLEARGFDLKLVNARHLKILPGRKTDVKDAEWIAEMLEHGLLRGSFVPPPAIRELRDLTRYRKRLTQAHSSESQRLQGTLEDAGIKLASVASDVLGVSGRAMLKAMLAGQSDPEVLAEFAKGQLRGRIPELKQALRGRFNEHHAVLVGLALDHIEHLEEAIARLDAEVDKVMAPFAEARDRIDQVTGVGKKAAECILAEIGVDMSVFPTAGHLASWAGCCPGNNITGGKRHSGRTTKGNRWLCEVLNQCAWAASRSHDTYLSAQFWRLAKRLGKKRAAVAVEHSILVVIYHLLKEGGNYRELGGRYFAERDVERQKDRLISQLRDLGYGVSITPVAAA